MHDDEDQDPRVDRERLSGGQDLPRSPHPGAIETLPLGAY